METSNNSVFPLALEVEQLTVSYGRTPVLWDISLSVPQGELVGIIGPNGAGKSTFLKALMGFIPVVAGKTLFLGQPLDKIKKKIAYIPQKESIDWNFPITVEELVMMGRFGELGFWRRPSVKDLKDLNECLEMLGLFPLKDRQIGQLSGGQQQRAFLARALIQEPDLFFLDEPFTGVDAVTESVLVEVLKKLKKQGKTVFIVHHDLNSAESLFSWVILLNLRLVVSNKSSIGLAGSYLKQAYGKNLILLDEAVKLSEDKFSGKI